MLLKPTIVLAATLVIALPKPPTPEGMVSYNCRNYPIISVTETRMSDDVFVTLLTSTWPGETLGLPKLDAYMAYSNAPVAWWNVEVFQAPN